MSDFEEEEEEVEEEEEEEEEVEAVPALGDGVAGVVLNEATMDDIGPVRNRYRRVGDPKGEAVGKIRRKATQNERASKRYKKQKETAESAAEGFNKVAIVLCGDGVTTGGYLNSRSKFSVKGRPIQKTPKKEINKIYGGENKVSGMEDIVIHQDVMPKYRIGQDTPKGKVKSKPMSPNKSARIGLKSMFPGEINKAIGIRLANKAVNMLNQFESKLAEQWDCAPTPHQIRAAMLLAILNAQENWNLPENERKPVCKDYKAP